MKFTHKELGPFAKVLGDAVLECRDPNDNGQSRYQYSLCNMTQIRRHLPADSDYWLDRKTGRRSRRPPVWEQLDSSAMDWGLLEAWYSHLASTLSVAPISSGAMTAACDNRAPVTLLAMRSRIELQGYSWPEWVPCPHCHSWIVWAEACYVPGYRICQGCHRHWQMRSDWPGPKYWSPNSRRYWPYG